MTIEQLLRFAVEQGASDLHLQTGSPPMLRILGQIRELELPPLTEEQVRQAVRAIGPRAIIDDVDKAMAQGHDFSYGFPPLARFRGNLGSARSTSCTCRR